MVKCRNIRLLLMGFLLILVHNACPKETSVPMRSTDTLVQDIAQLTDGIAQLILSCKQEPDAAKIHSFITLIISKLAKLIERIAEKRRLKKLQKLQQQKKCIVPEPEEDDSLNDIEEATLLIAYRIKELNHQAK